jgi:transcriptional regulator with XRE-family HTH domain
MEDIPTYGRRLLDALTAAGKTRRQLANALGITEQAVGNIVNGGAKTFFMANNSAEAAAFLGVDHYWLATGKGEREPRGSDWPFPNVSLDEVRALGDSERLQLEGAMRMVLSILWQARHPGEVDPYKITTTLPGRGPADAQPADLKALEERQRALEQAVRQAADHMRRAVGGPEAGRSDSAANAASA